MLRPNLMFEPGSGVFVSLPNIQDVVFVVVGFATLGWENGEAENG